MKQEAIEGNFHDEACIWLRWGVYEAALLPGVGANLVAFRDVDQGYQFLHEPSADQMKGFRERPFVYGIPVLFPPNRYEDGKFNWNQNTYEFPVNEQVTGNHLHGFIHNIPWNVDDYGVTKQESYVVTSLTVNEHHPMYTYFPHRFKLQIRYGLGEAGLSQQVQLYNQDKTELPCTIGFHTAINAPFAEESTAKDYTLKMTIGDRWELDDRMLPTGQFQTKTELEQQLGQTGIYPFAEALDHHYTAAPQNGRNLAEITDTRLGLTLVYDVGTTYRQWMVYNNSATEGFVCPEPQVNMVNAPNVKLPNEEKGLFSIEQGEIWEAVSRLYVRDD